MKYLIGLGNPGAEYKATKHNVGFRVIDAIAKECGIDIAKRRYSSLIGKAAIDGEEVLFIKPETYMNLSGKAIEELLRDNKSSLEDMSNVLVICDDVNLKLGRIRLRKSGSAGGHKGLESIINALGKSDFARLRLGIATDIHKGDITDYVLAPFKRKDSKHISGAIRMAKEAAIFWVKFGPENTMTRFNTRSSGTS